jgi:hypothetical protein
MLRRAEECSDARVRIEHPWATGVMAGVRFHSFSRNGSVAREWLRYIDGVRNSNYFRRRCSAPPGRHRSSLRPQGNYRANYNTRDQQRPPTAEHDGDRDRDCQDNDGADCIDRFSGHSTAPLVNDVRRWGLFETGQPGDLSLQFLRQMGQT